MAAKKKPTKPAAPVVMPKIDFAAMTPEEMQQAANISLGQPATIAAATPPPPTPIVATTPAMTGGEAQQAANVGLGQPAAQASEQPAQNKPSGGTEKPAADTTAERRQFVNSNQWENFVATRYPGLLKVYRTVPELADIIRNAYINGSTPDEIKNTIAASTWYRGLGSGEYEYIVGTETGDKAYAGKIDTRKSQIKDLARANYASYSIKEDVYNQITADSLKYGWAQSQIDEALGRAVAAGNTTQPTIPGVTPVTPPAGVTPNTPLQTGATAASVRERALAYGIGLTDGMVEDYVKAINNKTMTDQQVTDAFRQQAKMLYPSIAKQLDGGNLNDATASYRAIAAQTLGIDSSSVDFTNAKFKPLLTYQDPANKEYRLMNSTEWTGYLRKLPDWQKTKEASDTYTSLYNSLTKLFGKVS